MKVIYFYFITAFFLLVTVLLLFYRDYNELQTLTDQVSKRRQTVFYWQKLNSDLKSGLILSPLYRSHHLSERLFHLYQADFDDIQQDIKEIKQRVIEEVQRQRIDSIKNKVDHLQPWLESTSNTDLTSFENDSSAIEELLHVDHMISRGIARTEFNLDEQARVLTRVAVNTRALGLSLIIIAFSLIGFATWLLSKEVSLKSKLSRKLFSQNRFIESIIDSLVDSVIVQDSKQRVLYFNNEAEKQYKVKREDIVGKTIVEVFPSALNTEQYNAYVKALKGEFVRLKKVRSITNKFVEVIYVPLPNERVLTMVRDISGIVSTNLELAKLNQTFKYAEQASGIGSFRYNFQNDSYEYSENMFRILGCEVNEFEPSAETFYKFVHPDDLEIIKSAASHFKETNTLNDIEFRIVTKQGKLLYVRNTAFIVEEEGKRSLIGTVQDISTIRKAQAELEERKHFVETILNASVDSIVVVDSDLKILTVNAKAMSARGEYVVGKPIVEVFPNLKESGAYDDILQCLKGEFIHNKNYYSLVTEKVYENFYIPLRNSDGSVYAVVILAHDITDLVEAKKSAERSNRQLGQKNHELQRMNEELTSFVYVASHDLQEPLRKIQTFVLKIEQEDHTVSPKGLDYFRRVRNSAERMQLLITDLLTYSQISRSKEMFVETDLNLILTGLKDEFSDDGKNVVFNISPMPRLNVIPFQLEQLFTNLISNSIKFSKTEQPCLITVTCDLISARDLPAGDLLRKKKEYYKIIFQDNGIGFDDKYSQQIFKIFQRLHGKDQYPGTGLGLAICKKIIDNHEGLIFAHGEINEGATFTIFLPHNIKKPVVS
jgi:PAS domain S-box-containing protein